MRIDPVGEEIAEHNIDWHSTLTIFALKNYTEANEQEVYWPTISLSQAILSKKKSSHRLISWKNATAFTLIRLQTSIKLRIWVSIRRNKNDNDGYKVRTWKNCVGNNSCRRKEINSPYSSIPLYFLIWANNLIFSSITIPFHGSYPYSSFCCCLELLGRTKQECTSDSDRCF
jgi:hypothetical protein